MAGLGVTWGFAQGLFSTKVWGFACHHLVALKLIFKSVYTSSIAEQEVFKSF